MFFPILISLVVPTLCPAQGQSTPTAVVVNGKLGTTLDDYLARSTAFGFSGSVLIESNGELVLLKGYGLAERATHRANTPDTLFDIGSLTKQFTATAILRLEQDGKLSTTDTLSKFFKDVPSDKSKIQLYHLLTHTSGLPRGIQSVGSEMQDRAAMIKAVFAAPLQSKPGASFEYSNVGYDLLGAVVEIASGGTFEDYLRTNLFTPAHMTSTGFRKDGTIDATLAARGYKSASQPFLPGSIIQAVSEHDSEPSLATECWYSWGMRGCGGVVTTVLDLRTWQHALDGDAILQPRAKEKLFHPYKSDYACGWYVTKTDRGSNWIEHGGSTDNGFECKFTRFPDQHALMIVLGNVSGGPLPWVNLNLGKIVRGEQVPAIPAVGAFDAERAHAVEGAWEASGDAAFEVSVQDERVVLEALNDNALAWMLGTASPRAGALSKKTLEIARSLDKDDCKAIHAVEDRAYPLKWFDDWWRRFETQHGKRKRIDVIGVVNEPRQGDTSLLRVEFEKGLEILKLSWSGDTLTGVHIDPPYPSRRVLQPTTGNGWMEYDLIASKTLVELRPAAGEAAKPARLELLANGKTLTLTRGKAGR